MISRNKWHIGVQEHHIVFKSLTQLNYNVLVFIHFLCNVSLHNDSNLSPYLVMNTIETRLERKSSINFGAHIEFCSLPEVSYKFLVTKRYILLITRIHSDNLPAHAVHGVPGWTRVTCCAKKPYYHSCLRALYFHLFSHNGHQGRLATTCQELKVLELRVWNQIKFKQCALKISRVRCWFRNVFKACIGSLFFSRFLNIGVQFFYPTAHVLR